MATTPRGEGTDTKWQVFDQNGGLQGEVRDVSVNPGAHHDVVVIFQAGPPLSGKLVNYYIEKSDIVLVHGKERYDLRVRDFQDDVFVGHGQIQE